MDPTTLSINGQKFIAFPADELFEVCGVMRDLIKSMMSLPSAPRQEPVVGRKKEAEPTIPSPRVSTQKKPAPIKRVASASSSEATRAAKPNGAAALVLDALRDIGEGDIRAILDRLEARKISIESDDPEKTAASALYQTLGPKHLVEKVEGKRGWWRIAA